MTISVLFGVRTATLDDARALVEKTLGIALHARESLHHGGPYFSFGKLGLHELILQDNVDLLDDGPVEPSFPNYQCLLYLVGVAEDSGMLAKLRAAPDRFVTLRAEPR
jgi:hypothetical protein